MDRIRGEKSNRDEGDGQDKRRKKLTGMERMDRIRREKSNRDGGEGQDKKGKK